MEQQFKNDPRLQGIEPEKLALLETLVGEAQGTSPSQLLPFLLRMTKQNPNVSFNDSETEQILSILTAHMNPAQKKQVETIRSLSRTFAQASASPSSKK